MLNTDAVGRVVEDMRIEYQTHISLLCSIRFYYVINDWGPSQ